MNLIKKGESDIVKFDNAVTELLECATNNIGRGFFGTQLKNTLNEHYDVQTTYKQPEKSKTDMLKI